MQLTAVRFKKVIKGLTGFFIFKTCYTKKITNQIQLKSLMYNKNFIKVRLVDAPQEFN